MWNYNVNSNYLLILESIPEDQLESTSTSEMPEHTAERGTEETSVSDTQTLQSEPATETHKPESPPKSTAESEGMFFRFYLIQTIESHYYKHQTVLPRPAKISSPKSV